MHSPDGPSGIEPGPPLPPAPAPVGPLDRQPPGVSSRGARPLSLNRESFYCLTSLNQIVKIICLDTMMTVLHRSITTFVCRLMKYFGTYLGGTSRVLGGESGPARPPAESSGAVGFRGRALGRLSARAQAESRLGVRCGGRKKACGPMGSGAPRLAASTLRRQTKGP